MLLKGGVIAAAFAALAGGGTAAAVSAASPHARLTGFTCHRALQPRDRMVAITAVMRPVPATHRMHLRFVLLRQWRFDVQFTDAGAVRSRSVAGLGAHGTLRVTFIGPVCTPPGAPTVTVDPDHRVGDYDRANNSMTATCPAASGSAARARLHFA